MDQLLFSLGQQSFLGMQPILTPYGYIQNQLRLCLMSPFYYIQGGNPLIQLHNEQNSNQATKKLENSDIQQDKKSSCITKADDKMEDNKKELKQSKPSKKNQTNSNKESERMSEISSQASYSEEIDPSEESDYKPNYQKHIHTLKRGRGLLWTTEEVSKLIKKYDEYDGDWKQIVKNFAGRSMSQCSQKFRKVMKNNYVKKKNKWTLVEDKKLLEEVKRHGQDWRIISKHFSDRTLKQIKTHYINKLDPTLSDQPWTNQEDEKLLQLYLQYGKKWTYFSKEYGNRSENQIKNRFYYCIKKRFLDNGCSVRTSTDQNLKESDSGFQVNNSSKIF